MRHHSHPCGSLPLQQLSFTAWWCRVHQAWWYSAYLVDQDGEECSEPLWSEAIELGPFDGAEELLTAFQRLLAARASGERLPQL